MGNPARARGRGVLRTTSSPRTLKISAAFGPRISGANSPALGDGQLRHAQASQGTWLQRHPRFVPHFVPTSSNWLNLVEGWFGELTSKRIRRGSFGSMEDL